MVQIVRDLGRAPEGQPAVHLPPRQRSMGLDGRLVGAISLEAPLHHAIRLGEALLHIAEVVIHHDIDIVRVFVVDHGRPLPGGLLQPGVLPGRVLGVGRPGHGGRRLSDRRTARR